MLRQVTQELLDVNVNYENKQDCDIFASRQKRHIAMTFQVAVKLYGYLYTSFFYP
jgi:hypothetical protein